MGDRKPDYERYTLDELIEARDSIDVNRYGDRAQELDQLIQERTLATRRARRDAGPPPPADPGDDWNAEGRHEYSPPALVVGALITGGLAWMVFSEQLDVTRWGFERREALMILGLFAFANLVGAVISWFWSKRVAHAEAAGRMAGEETFARRARSVADRRFEGGRCPFCGTAVQPTYDYCPSCGEDI